jgi:hypothetical protein
MKKHFFLGLLGFLVIALLPRLANAEVMSDQNYNLENKNLEVQTFRQITPKPIQNPAGVKPYSQGKNYKAYADTSSSFGFTVSHDTINFGKPTATNPVIRLLYLTTAPKISYQILVSENHPLVADKNTIPDTTCDSGSCTEITSSTWISTLTYGFGYRSSTTPENEYKQFPDLSKKEHFEALLQDKITYKVNVATTQQQGAYSNVVTYIAVPNF